jgi:phytoene dehydrogenase-like protein
MGRHAKEELFAIVMRQITRYAPGFGNSVIHKQVLVPQDLERMFDLPGGHVHHGELSIDQIFFRRPGCRLRRLSVTDQESLSVRGLDPSGRRCHRRAGHNAARLIIKEYRRNPNPYPALPRS